MSKEINKPLSVSRMDFIDALLSLIKNSHLPLIIIEPIIKDTLNDIHALNQKQLEMDLKHYEEEIEGIKSNDKT